MNLFLNKFISSRYNSKKYPHKTTNIFASIYQPRTTPSIQEFPMNLGRNRKILKIKQTLVNPSVSSTLLQTISGVGTPEAPHLKVTLLPRRTVRSIGVVVKMGLAKGGLTGFKSFRECSVERR